MNTTDGVRITIANQPNFANKVLAILKNIAEHIHCSGTKKAKVLSTVRNCKVFSEIDIHPVLGHINVLKIMHKLYKKNE